MAIEYVTHVKNFRPVTHIINTNVFLIPKGRWYMLLQEASIFCCTYLYFFSTCGNINNFRTPFTDKNVNK